MRLLLSLLSLFIGINLHSQSLKDDTSFPNGDVLVSAYSEGTQVSLGFEYFFQSKKFSSLTHVVGVFAGMSKEKTLCIYNSCPPSDTYYTANFHYSVNLGTSRSRFELGVGAGGIGNTLGAYSLIGYRFVPLKKNNLLFRVTISQPVYLVEASKIYYSSIGAGVGFSF